MDRTSTRQPTLQGTNVRDNRLVFGERTACVSVGSLDHGDIDLLVYMC